MRKVLLGLLSLSFVAISLGAFAQKKEDVFAVDVAKSKISWKGTTIAGSGHTGTISLEKGKLVLLDKQLKAGEFGIDVTGIQVTDLQGDRAVRLTNHLKSEDFFEVEKYPKASFVITNIVGEGAEVVITGDLTLKDVKKSIKFPATVSRTENQVIATAKGVTFNRTYFNVKYRSGSFFSGLGDKAISDEISLDIELVATK